jgi:hypothetical protein
MATINLVTVERVSIVYSIVISCRQKSDSQKRREQDLDNTFSTDVASPIVYHRTNGQVLSNLRGWLREEYFEVDPGTESQVGDNSLVLRLPSHRFYFTVGNNDWLEIEGMMYNVILSKRNMGGTTTLLLHLK